jgi:Pyruvate/2-oxoacid:ferredoxin oxidoreductase gamma subunit
MVALGYLIAHKKTVRKETVLRVFQDMAPSGRHDLIEINKKALEEGMKLK